MLLERGFKDNNLLNYLKLTAYLYKNKYEFYVKISIKNTNNNLTVAITQDLYKYFYLYNNENESILCDYSNLENEKYILLNNKKYIEFSIIFNVPDNFFINSDKIIFKVNIFDMENEIFSFPYPSKIIFEDASQTYKDMFKILGIW